jgi:hypothetical protein
MLYASSDPLPKEKKEIAFRKLHMEPELHIALYLGCSHAKRWVKSADVPDVFPCCMMFLAF